MTIFAPVFAAGASGPPKTPPQSRSRAEPGAESFAMGTPKSGPPDGHDSWEDFAKETITTVGGVPDELGAAFSEALSGWDSAACRRARGAKTAVGGLQPLASALCDHEHSTRDWLGPTRHLVRKVFEAVSSQPLRKSQAFLESMIVSEFESVDLVSVSGAREGDDARLLSLLKVALNPIQERLTKIEKAGKPSATPVASPVKKKKAAKADDSGDEEDEEDAKPSGTVEILRARMAFLGQRSSEVFDECCADYKDDPAWPWAGTERAARVAPQLLANLFRGGRKAVESMEAWIARRRLEETEDGRTLLLIATTLDYLMLFDRVSMLNSAAVEVLCRRAHGLQLELERVTGPQDLARRGRHLQYLDLVRFDALNSGPAVEKEMRTAMRFEAEYNKWSEKTEKAEKAGTGAGKTGGAGKP